MYVVLCHFRLLPLWSSFVLLRNFFPCASSVMHPACHHVRPPCDYQSSSLLSNPPYFSNPPISHFLSLHYFSVKSSELPSMHVHFIQLELALLSSESAHFLSKFSALPSLQAGNFIFSCLFHDSNQRSLAPKPSTLPAVLATLR